MGMPGCMGMLPHPPGYAQGRPPPPIGLPGFPFSPGRRGVGYTTPNPGRKAPGDLEHASGPAAESQGKSGAGLAGHHLPPPLPKWLRRNFEAAGAQFTEMSRLLRGGGGGEATRPNMKDHFVPEMEMCASSPIHLRQSFLFPAPSLLFSNIFGE